jgi:hypothetical protein
MVGHNVKSPYINISVAEPQGAETFGQSQNEVSAHELDKVDVYVSF